jgi:hypothetical protein
VTEPKRAVRSRRKASESAGQRFRAGILADYELSVPERAVLEQAVDLLDQLERINGELAKQPVTTPGSRGQVAANPLFDAARRHADTLSRVLDALHIPMPGEGEGESATTKRARRAAEARWGTKGAG